MPKSLKAEVVQAVHSDLPHADAMRYRFGLDDANYAILEGKLDIQSCYTHYICLRIIPEQIPAHSVCVAIKCANSLHECTHTVT